MKLAMGCDPAAYRFYQKLLERMKDEGYDIIDTGCESENEADGGKYAEIAEIEMPASTVSDDTIETLKSIYSMYLEWKEKQE